MSNYLSNPMQRNGPNPDANAQQTDFRIPAAGVSPNVPTFPLGWDVMGVPDTIPLYVQPNYLPSAPNLTGTAMGY